MSVCYRLKGKVWRTSHGYYVLYLHIRGAPENVRDVLEKIVGNEVDIAILCP